MVKAARQRKTVTYGYLMKKFGIPRGRAGGRGITAVIGEIDKREEDAKAPGFGAIVVRKDTGFPGGGFFCYDELPVDVRRETNSRRNPRLSKAEKEYVMKERQRIWDFYQRRRQSE